MVAMPRKLELNDDRLFPAQASVRAIARDLYESVRGLPIISPHGHTDPQWFADNEKFSNATELLLAPDHYLYRMLYSQGIDLDAVGVARRGTESNADPRAAWRLFAKNFRLFRGTPSQLWLNYVFAKVFALDVALEEETADLYFDAIGEKLRSDAFRPRALYERFNIEILTTTEAPDDPLAHHKKIRDSGWKGQVYPTYRPDPVIDAEHESFDAALEQFARVSGEDVHSWKGFLAAHRKRRSDFAKAGATATDHGHPSAQTADLSDSEADALFQKILRGRSTPADAALFRAQMLTEMAKMSLEDGLVMQIHPGSFRNHNRLLHRDFGRDKGADIPMPTDYVRALKPLLDRFGNEKSLTIILFTLDESAYARELGPLAGHYPVLKLGPAWWFHDSPEGMRRFRDQTLESAGIYNTVGFNDDTRAFLSIPARHDLARRVDCAFLANLVAEHRLDQDEAREIAVDLAYRLPKKAYRFNGTH